MNTIFMKRWRVRSKPNQPKKQPKRIYSLFKYWPIRIQVRHDTKNKHPKHTHIHAHTHSLLHIFTSSPQTYKFVEFTHWPPRPGFTFTQPYISNLWPKQRLRCLGLVSCFECKSLKFKNNNKNSKFNEIKQETQLFKNLPYPHTKWSLYYNR